MLRAFAPGGAGEPLVGARLREVAAAQREKLAWLATPRPDTRESLAAALRADLISAAAGNLDGLGRPSHPEALPTAAVTRWWLTRLAHVSQWALVGLGPIFL